MDEQSVKYRWAKKVIGKSDPLGFKWYLVSPGYIKLDSDGDAGVVAFKFPLVEEKPEHLDWCTEQESERMEKYSNAFTPRDRKRSLLEEAKSMFPSATRDELKVILA